jgi:hypothetical protein
MQYGAFRCYTDVTWPQILKLLDGVCNCMRRKVKHPTHKINLWTTFYFTTLTLNLFCHQDESSYSGFDSENQLL